MGNLLGVGILKTRETYTAVVVNGNQSQLVMLSGILQQDGLQVTSYENAEDALVLMNSQVDEKGPPDVIVTDLYTPGLDGWRFCRLLRSMEYPDFNSTPILVIPPALSGADPREVLSSLDANELLTAPYDPSGLLSKVRKLLQRQQPQIDVTVLVVNSDEERGATLKHAFQNRGCQVDLAGTAGEVEQRLEICAPDFAVLFPNLEDTTPGELLERVKTQGPANIVILVTEETDTQRSV